MKNVTKTDFSYGSVSNEYHLMGLGLRAEIRGLKMKKLKHWNIINNDLGALKKGGPKNHCQKEHYKYGCFLPKKSLVVLLPKRCLYLNCNLYIVSCRGVAQLGGLKILIWEAFGNSRMFPDLKPDREISDSREMAFGNADL